MGKLVRDKVPRIIEESGKNVKVRTLSDDEFKDEVYNKLREEVEELCEKRNAEEMADVLEVIKAIHYSDPETYDDVFRQSVKKRKERGSFYNKKYLEEVN